MKFEVQSVDVWILCLRIPLSLQVQPTPVVHVVLTIDVTALPMRSPNRHLPDQRSICGAVLSGGEGAGP